MWPECASSKLEYAIIDAGAKDAKGEQSLLIFRLPTGICIASVFIHLEQDPILGLLDRRCRRPSHRTGPRAEVQRVLHLYRERYQDFNVRQFHHLAWRDHGVTLSYSFVRLALQAAGLVGKGRARGRHRRRREPRRCFGELLHLDGSSHPGSPSAPPSGRP